jgi:hypothetical protein
VRPVPPNPYPLHLSETRVVSRQAMVSYRGDFYPVLPELACAAVAVTHDSMSRPSIALPTQGSWSPTPAGTRRRRIQIRDHGHVAALDTLAIKAAAATRGLHRRKKGSHPASCPSRRRDPARRAADSVQRGAVQPAIEFVDGKGRRRRGPTLRPHSGHVRCDRHDDGWPPWAAHLVLDHPRTRCGADSEHPGRDLRRGARQPICSGSLSSGHGEAPPGWGSRRRLFHLLRGAKVVQTAVVRGTPGRLRAHGALTTS